MESPFFRNHRCYQQPDPMGHPSSRSLSFRGVPVYHVDPASEPHRPVQRPSERSSSPKVVQIPVHFVGSEQVDRTGSAVLIQKVFRGFLVRKCLKKIKDIKVQIDGIEERLSKREVVELVRRNEKERLKMNETLMSQLFKLDSICGLDFGVRVCRKAVIRKAIALQERIDAIVSANMEHNGENDDHETGIRVPEGTDNSNTHDHVMNPTNSSEDSGDLEDNGECGENLEVVSCVEGNKNSMESEGNDGEAGVIDVGVDSEVKVGEYNANGVCENFDVVEEGVRESFSEGEEKGKIGTRFDGDKEGKAKKGNGVEDDNKRNRELLEKMMEDNEKMMSLMTQLFERNEMQTRMLNALTHRVELLEKAVVCDRLRKKKKTKATPQCKET